MKIEKINDNQIKCILTKADLDNRDINITELAYGTQKATQLFREMAEQANEKYGFKTGDMPLMIEAIPLPHDSIAIIITKVEDPEELDTRFSRFSPTHEDIADATQIENQIKKEYTNKANEVLNIMDSFRKVMHEKSSNSLSNEDNLEKNSTTKNYNNNLTMIYSFRNMDNLISLSYVLCDKYSGTNSLLYNSADKIYYLILEKSDHTPEQFNQVCNIVCEYGEKSKYNENSQSYLYEHFEMILKSNALQQLSKIKAS